MCCCRLGAKGSSFSWDIVILLYTPLGIPTAPPHRVGIVLLSTSQRGVAKVNNIALSLRLPICTAFFGTPCKLSTVELATIFCFEPCNWMKEQGSADLKQLRKIVFFLTTEALPPLYYYCTLLLLCRTAAGFVWNTDREEKKYSTTTYNDILELSLQGWVGHLCSSSKTHRSPKLWWSTVVFQKKSTRAQKGKA